MTDQSDNVVPPNVEELGSPPPTLKQTHEGEHHGDFGDQDVPLLYATKIFALCAAVNSCNLGFDIGVSTSVGPLIQDDFGLSDVQREIFVGSLNFFAMFGALSSNWFSDNMEDDKPLLWQRWVLSVALSYAHSPPILRSYSLAGPLLVWV